MLRLFCGMRGVMGLPVVASHTRAPPVQLEVRIRRPSGLNCASPHPLPSGLYCALPVPLPCGIGGVIGLPVSASHTLAVLSPLEVTTRRPSGLNSALYTRLLWNQHCAGLGHSRKVSANR